MSVQTAVASSATTAPSSALPSAYARPSILELHDVRFAYPDGTEVLAGISTAIPAGAIVGIVGPSGCGKSTLLYLISRLLAPTGGVIERHLDPEPDRHALSMVFQKDTLAPWLTAAENVRFFTRFKAHGVKGGKLRAVARAGRRQRQSSDSDLIDARVASLLRMANLHDKAKAYPYQLSGGMRRRLAFLAGVAPHPQILLLDEPFSSVDEPTRIGIHHDVSKVIRTLDMTAILVTHDLAEAVTLCDQVLILSNRPARIASQHAIPFGTDRDMLHIRGRPEFLKLYGRLWDDLSRQIEAAPTPDVPWLVKDSE
jgi:ABC-type nitrate/sulfonate/bicarbonate transport system ATPase subunit